ncbi:MAG: response regulator transcription factor [Selenomonadaceae bacterium]
MVQYSVLVVDDDVKLLEIMKTYFLKENFVVHTARDGETALQMIARHKPSLVLLDLMLPGMDGREICRRIRQHNDLPIIMLTAKDDESDRVIGLEMGADDYVTKPFSIKEVIARVRALLRRVHGEVIEPKHIMEFRDMVMDLQQHAVWYKGTALELTPIEFKLLEVLMKSPRRVFNRLQLMENTHGFAFDGYERTIDAHIRNLRRKVEPDSKKPQYILTVYGVGYKFAGDENEKNE